MNEKYYKVACRSYMLHIRTLLSLQSAVYNQEFSNLLILNLKGFDVFRGVVLRGVDLRGDVVVLQLV